LLQKNYFTMVLSILKEKNNLYKDVITKYQKLANSLGSTACMGKK